MIKLHELIKATGRVATRQHLFEKILAPNGAKLIKLQLGRVVSNQEINESEVLKHLIESTTNYFRISKNQSYEYVLCLDDGSILEMRIRRPFGVFEDKDGVLYQIDKDKWKKSKDNE